MQGACMHASQDFVNFTALVNFTACAGGGVVACAMPCHGMSCHGTRTARLGAGPVGPAAGSLGLRRGGSEGAGEGRGAGAGRGRGGVDRDSEKARHARHARHARRPAVRRRSWQAVDGLRGPCWALLGLAGPCRRPAGARAGARAGAGEAAGRRKVDRVDKICQLCQLGAVEARQGKARQGRARQGKARQGQGKDTG